MDRHTGHRIQRSKEEEMGPKEGQSQKKGKRNQEGRTLPSLTKRTFKGTGEEQVREKCFPRSLNSECSGEGEGVR